MPNTYSFQYQGFRFRCRVEESADGQYLDLSSADLSLAFSAADGFALAEKARR